MSDNEDFILSQDNNRLVGKILTVWERYKPLLEHDCFRAGYMLSVDSNTYAHAKVSGLYIYVNYHVIFLQFTILKNSNFFIIYMQDHYTSEYYMIMVWVISKLYCCQSEEELGQNIYPFLVEHEKFCSRTGSFQTSYI